MRKIIDDDFLFLINKISYLILLNINLEKQFYN